MCVRVKLKRESSKSKCEHTLFRVEDPRMSGTECLEIFDKTTLTTSTVSLFPAFPYLVDLFNRGCDFRTVEQNITSSRKQNLIRMCLKKNSYKKEVIPVFKF